MRGFPPVPVYPNAIDDDSTLYAVYNTSQSILAIDNIALSEEIQIVPVGIDDDEIWGDNGFINISGELIYYDLVEKDINGKIFKFKRCLRNFGGSASQYNPAGTSVYGFVVADHHNQLADALLNIEDFVGYNFTPDQSTLDWRIRNLQNTPFIFDECPTIVLTTTTLSTDPAQGTTISYTIDITGTLTDFTLQFGDGSFTKSTQSGTHTYVPNANIDPVITASSGDCTITQTAVERGSTDEPTAPSTTNVFNINIQAIPSFPDISVSVAPCAFDLPVIPINFPCLNLSLSNFQFPSTIDVLGCIPSIVNVEFPSIGGISGISGISTGFFNIPSFIAFGPVNIPSIISIESPSFTIPSVISFIAPSFTIPSVISFSPPSIHFPSIISFGPVPSFPQISFQTPFFPLVQFAPVQFPIIEILVPDFPLISFTDPPVISVDWGTPPVISCNCSIACPGASSVAEWQQSYLDDLNDELGDSSVQAPSMEYNFAGIPSEIKIVPANIPQAILLNHDLPDTIEVVVPSYAEISLNADAMPREINLIVPEIRDIRIIGAEDIPSIIEIKSDIPDKISLVGISIPDTINLVGNVPSEIKVTGMPESISLHHSLPDFIEIKMPQERTIQIDPISVIVKLDMNEIVANNEEERQCFALVPCGKTK